MYCNVIIIGNIYKIFSIGVYILLFLCVKFLVVFFGRILDFKLVFFYGLFWDLCDVIWFCCVVMFRIVLISFIWFLICGKGC